MELCQNPSLMAQHKPLFYMGFRAAFVLFVLVVTGTTHSQDWGAKNFDASADYITDCKYATCVGLAGSEWSEKNPYGVAVGVSMGTKPAVTDAQIKMVLSHDFSQYGITKIKFFYEHHHGIASAITLHVRGGTEGPFVIGNVRQEVKAIAERVKNKNPALVIH